MMTINRTLLIVAPKKPFIDWANSFEEDTSVIEPVSAYHSAYLIPEKYDESNFKIYLKKHFLTIFEEELYSMITDADIWPQKRDYKTFNEWFDTNACDTVFDLSQEPLIKEEL
jgi:hypothetical protein